MKRIIPLESQEAKTFKSWADYHPIAKHQLIHIANECKTSYQNGKHLKDMGKKKGVSDYFLAYPSNGKAGLWIELKRVCKSVSRITLEQAEWLARCERHGYATFVAYGAEQAIKAVEDYCNGK